LVTDQEIRETWRKATLDAFRDEYREHSEIWRSLESKAQGNVAVAGIFVAGSLAYLTKSDLKLHQHEVIFLLAAVVCLIVSVLLSILTIKTQEITPPPLGSFVNHFVRVLLPMDPACFKGFLETFYADHANQWTKVIAELRESNETKAHLLWRAQEFLIAAILAVAALSLSKLIY
jgi:hypothetical protein